MILGGPLARSMRRPKWFTADEEDLHRRPFEQHVHYVDPFDGLRRHAIYWQFKKQGQWYKVYQGDVPEPDEPPPSPRYRMRIPTVVPDEMEPT